MIKKHISLVLVLTLLVALFTGCNSKTEKNTGDANVTSYPKVTVRIGWPGTGTWSGVQGLAYKKGYFEEELAKVNATIEVTGFSGSGPEINAALTGKSLDGAIYGDVPAVQVKSKGTDTTLVGGFISDNNSVLVVKKDIASVADLKGKRVGAGFGTYMHRILGVFLATGGLSLPKTDGTGSKDVEFLNLSGNNAVAGFTQGDIDAFLTSHITALKLEDDTYNILLTSKGTTDWSYTENVIFRTEFAEKYPQVVVAFLKALIRSGDYAKDHVDELKALAVEAGSVAEDVEEVKPNIGDWSLSFEATPDFLKSLTNTTKWLVAEGLSTEEVDINKWLDASFYETAKKEYDAEKK